MGYCSLVTCIRAVDDVDAVPIRRMELREVAVSACVSGSVLIGEYALAWALSIETKGGRDDMSMVATLLFIL